MNDVYVVCIREEIFLHAVSCVVEAIMYVPVYHIFCYKKDLFVSVRLHICRASYMLSPVCLSVRPSVTWVD